MSQNAIDEIMDHFDFGKVARVMDALEWQWHTADGIVTPDESMLRKCARGLLRDAATQGKGFFTGTGGFNAENLGDGNLRLTFEVAEWYTTI